MHFQCLPYSSFTTAIDTCKFELASSCSCVIFPLSLLSPLSLTTWEGFLFGFIVPFISEKVFSHFLSELIIFQCLFSWELRDLRHWYTMNSIKSAL